MNVGRVSDLPFERRAGLRPALPGSRHSSAEEGQDKYPYPKNNTVADEEG